MVKSKTGYRGKYRTFNPEVIRTYPVSTRKNKVTLGSLAEPSKVLGSEYGVDRETEEKISEVAELVRSARQKKQPVILFTGAHAVKNGFGPLICDLMQKGILTLVAGNGATAIHDFELALSGETSESVPNALAKGEFGMAFELSYINKAVNCGSEQGLGYGESLGKSINENLIHEKKVKFQHPEVSILATGYRLNIPVTIHISIGTDVNNQHPGFSGEAAGETSYRDFLVFANEVTRLTSGGVVLNIGSAVTGPEVLLKAVSMSANSGSKPEGIICADFDIRPGDAGEMDNDSSHFYYLRDQKSVVTRIPQSFNGKGFYVQGNQKLTFPLLYKKILRGNK